MHKQAEKKKLLNNNMLRFICLSPRLLNKYSEPISFGNVILHGKDALHKPSTFA